MMNRNINTPSPGLMRNSSAESPTQMSNIYNQSQLNREQYQTFPNNFNLSTSITGNQSQGTVENNELNNSIMLDATNVVLQNNNSSNFNIMHSQPQTQFTPSNIFVNRTSGGSFTPICANSNINTGNIQSINITNNKQQVQAVFETANNIVFNQFQDSNISADSSLFNLSQLDDLVPLQNSDELRISNLSIST